MHLRDGSACCRSAKVLSETRYAVDSEIVDLISRPNSQWVRVRVSFGEMIPEPVNIRGDRAFSALN